MQTLDYPASMTRSTALLAMLLTSAIATAGVYKWVDKEGNIHYSDTAPPHGLATEVDLPEPSRYKPRPIPSLDTEAQTGKTSTDADETDKPTSYPVVTIVKPENGGTVRSNEGIVAIEVQLEPALAKGHVMAFSLDGTAIPDKVASTSFQITSVDRGTHSLTASVQDEQGKELGRSASVTFTLRKASLFERGDAARKEENAKGTRQSAVPNESRDAPSRNSSNAFDPSEEGISTTPGSTNPDFQPSNQSARPSNGISTTPGRTNPAYAPSYTR